MARIKLTQFNYPSVHVTKHELIQEDGKSKILIVAVSNVDKENGEHKQFYRDISVEKEQLTHQHFIDIINDINIDCYEFITGDYFEEEEKKERCKSNFYTVSDLKP